MDSTTNPRARQDDPWILFLTCALSHIALIPSTVLFWRRRWLYECGFSAAGLLCSFMYHTCEAFNTELILTELQWHILDNIFVIAGFVNLFTYLTVLHDGKLEFALKTVGALIALILQTRSPWDLSHTVVPIVSYFAIPFTWVILIQRTFSLYNTKMLTVGLGYLAVAVPFFILGLDDAHDPFRMFHGLWHVFIGGSSYYMWRVVKNPHATNLQSIIFADTKHSSYAMMSKLKGEHNSTYSHGAIQMDAKTLYYNFSRD